jgi:DNA modification methylase
MWSNEGDIVLSPFMGIASEGYMAIKHRRRFVGIELKDTYYEQAAKNMARAEKEATSGQLF